MNILITGGAGFIGSHLCDSLFERQHKITVIDNLILGRKENIQHLIDKSDFKFIQAYILNLRELKEIFFENQFDMVYHLAENSDIQKGGNNPMVDYNLTFNTTFSILQCMREFSVRKLFFASTSAIYGETSENCKENIKRNRLYEQII